MLLKKHSFLSVAQTFFLLAITVLMVSCGVDRPVAVTDDAARIAPDPGQAAAKRIKSNGTYATVDNTGSVSYSDDGRTVTCVFGPEGGTFMVKDDNATRYKKDDLRVSLSVPAGVLDAAVEMTLRVNGEDLNTLDVVFEPAGFEFRVPVDMRIDLGNDLVLNRDINKITPYHLYADGTTADVEVYHIDRSSHTANFYIKVPGFSRYGLRGR